MVLEIWYVCFDFMEKIAKQIEFALSCTYSVFTYFSAPYKTYMNLFFLFSDFSDILKPWKVMQNVVDGYFMYDSVKINTLLVYIAQYY